MSHQKSLSNNIAGKIIYDSMGVQVVITKDSFGAIAPGNEAEQKEKAQKNPRVRFGDVTVHIHRLTLGDNPGGTTPGPPLTIEWESDDKLYYESVEEYEAATNINNQRSRKNEIRGEHLARIIDGTIRSRIVAVDHTANEMKRALLEIYQIRQEREKSKDEDIEKAEKKEEEKRAIKELLANKKGVGGKRKNGSILNSLLARLIIRSKCIKSDLTGILESSFHSTNFANKLST